MPEVDSIKIVPHPGKREGDVSAPRPVANLPYAEIQVTTNFTFLTGASHPEEYADRAAALGYRGLAITDTNSLAGVVRMHVAAKQAGLPLSVGCRLELQTEAQRPTVSVLVYPTDRSSYGGLCQLLTRGRLRGAKGECHLTVHDLLEFETGLLAVIVPPREIDQHFIETATGLKRAFTPRRLSIALVRPFSHDDDRRMQCLAALARQLGLSLAASNDVRHHAPERKPLLDVVTCIRHGVTLDEAGYRLGLLDRSPQLGKFWTLLILERQNRHPRFEIDLYPLNSVHLLQLLFKPVNTKRATESLDGYGDPRNLRSSRRIPSYGGYRDEIK